MSTVTSSDGTQIAYETSGSGPALILVDGALCHREFGPSADLAELLEPHFTVYRYDRRGRGQSGDIQPYSREREVDDLAALVQAAGGSAHLYGISSGGALALDAANRVPGVDKVAIYEPPFVVDPSGNVIPDDFRRRLQHLVDAGERGKAVRAFMRLVGAPAIVAAIMRVTPAWKKLKAVAHTLPYDFAILEGTGRGEPLPADRWSSVSAPTLVMAGGKSDEWMRDGARGVLGVVPHSEYRTLEGQNHMLKAEAVAPVLIEHFAAPRREPAAA